MTTTAILFLLVVWTLVFSIIFLSLRRLIKVEK